ncbi:unnamed protein product [Enterobius vermicularis]|uniref:Protein YIF1 n=1 Tax=Enterobius vermicularis TaxID=51028 RepID=A0A0N4UY73_ENTVE|nr:unnamed protein product [Enterobius vermicularis]
MADSSWGWDSSQNQQNNYNSYNMDWADSQSWNQPSFSMPDSFSQSFVSDPMLNAAKQIGGQFAEQQREKLARYLSAFQLKYYFAVDNSYVGKKLGILLFPFAHRDWSVCYNSSDTPVPPRMDINAPDLYIPIMAFTTYVLVSGIVLGTQGRFTPEQLGIITTNALIYLVLENILLLITKYVMNISQALSFWHTLAYSSYKYLGMVVSLLAFLLGGKTPYYGVLGYTSVAIVFFLLRTVKNFVLDVQNMYSHDAARKRKLYLLLFISFTQPFIMWWLTSGVTTSAAGKMDFAQLALSGMGLKELASKGHVPVLPDGDIDYEALLKMP